MVSKIYKCDQCPRRTTDPFYISGKVLCTVCAEEFSPNIVSSREIANYRRYTRSVWIDKGFGREKRPER